MSQGARQRLIDAALSLFRCGGVAGTGVAEILERSGAGRGSIYAHFPGGKAELAEAATRAGGDAMTELIIATAQDQPDMTAALDAFVAYWRQILVDSGFEAGCPIVAAALQGDQAPGARDVAGEVFASWQEVCAQIMQRQGVPADRARPAAALIVTAIEGAIIVARAQRSITPLEHVAGELAALARALPRGDTAGA